MSKILCFGDSITWGAWDPEGGWVARIRKKIDKLCIESGLDTFVLTYNLGISSDTSTNLLDRFDSEARAYTIEEGLPQFIISIGTNDSILRTRENTHWVELTDFESNIRNIIQKAKNYSGRIAFVGNLPVDESKTQPYRDDASISSSNDDIKAYEEMTKKVCGEEGVDFVPIFEEAQTLEYVDMLFTDGIHPNSKGHEFIASKVEEYITTNGWVPT